MNWCGINCSWELRILDLRIETPQTCHPDGGGNSIAEVANEDSSFVGMTTKPLTTMKLFDCVPLVGLEGFSEQAKK